MQMTLTLSVEATPFCLHEKRYIYAKLSEYFLTSPFAFIDRLQDVFKNKNHFFRERSTCHFTYVLNFFSYFLVSTVNTTEGFSVS